MDDKQENKVVVWSGGFDSTALVLDLLEKGNNIYTISTRLLNNEGQQYSEYVARQTIRQALEIKFPGKLRCGTDTEIRQEVGVIEYGLVQPILWAANMVMASPHEEVYLGYVKGDDFWHHKSDFEEVVSRMAKIMHRKIKINCPYEWSTKEDLLDIYNKHPEILEYISTCERYGNWRYCDCHKCDDMLRLYNMFRAKRGESVWARPARPHAVIGEGLQLGPQIKAVA
jgi:7-cyano-7-deazaguanine synthase in queuosine biosynthesis